MLPILELHSNQKDINHYSLFSLEYTRINSVITTRSSTPENPKSQDNYIDELRKSSFEASTSVSGSIGDVDIDNNSINHYEQSSSTQYISDKFEINNNNFEIDVCPKKKTFSTLEERKVFVEDYKRKYKTELCKNWEIKGECKFGDKCSFAHGKYEIQNKIIPHSKYKTKPCKQYHQTGYCSYGQRCQYLHKDALKPNILFVYHDDLLTSEYKSYTYDQLHEINMMCACNDDIHKILDKLPKRQRLAVFRKLVEENVYNSDHGDDIVNNEYIQHEINQQLS